MSLAFVKIIRLIGFIVVVSYLQYSEVFLAGIILDLASLLLGLMSMPNEDNMASHAQVSLSIYKNTFCFVT